LHAKQMNGEDSIEYINLKNKIINVGETKIDFKSEVEEENTKSEDEHDETNTIRAKKVL
jgi:hypothetical protein